MRCLLTRGFITQEPCPTFVIVCCTTELTDCPEPGKATVQVVDRLMESRGVDRTRPVDPQERDNGYQETQAKLMP